MILIEAEQLSDGLYNIKNGQIFKYKAKGGTVRAYVMKGIKTKIVKYYDEDENVWKTGEVIVDE